MTLPILIEPISTGFRASTGSPLNWIAEGTTAESATAGIRERYAQLLASGARVVEIDIRAGHSLSELAARLSENPFLQEWTDAVQEVRRQRDLADAEELASEELALSSPHTERKGLVEDFQRNVESMP